MKRLLEILRDLVCLSFEPLICVGIYFVVIALGFSLMVLGDFLFEPGMNLRELIIRERDQFIP